MEYELRGRNQVRIEQSLEFWPREKRVARDLAGRNNWDEGVWFTGGVGKGELGRAGF